MKISLITVVLNSCNYIERTIRSVSAQTYPDIEYIILDGSSTDGTIDIINQHLDQVDVFRSERDRGISDAWNKGLAIASGDVVGLLNAGDEYAPDAVSKAVEAIQAGADFVYGDTEIVDDQGQILLRSQGRFKLRFYSGSIGFFHPSCFGTKALYNRIGGFDPNLRYAMDVDWILRAHKSGAIISHSLATVKMVNGGISVVNQFSAYGEYLHSLKKNGYGHSYIYLSMLFSGLRGLARLILKGA